MEGNRQVLFINGLLALRVRINFILLPLMVTSYFEILETLSAGVYQRISLKVSNITITYSRTIISGITHV